MCAFLGSPAVSAGALSSGLAATGPRLQVLVLRSTARRGHEPAPQARPHTSAGRHLMSPVPDPAPATIELVSRPAAGLFCEPRTGPGVDRATETAGEPQKTLVAGGTQFANRTSLPPCAHAARRHSWRAGEASVGPWTRFAAKETTSAENSLFLAIAALQYSDQDANIQRETMSTGTVDAIVVITRS